jgi:hypothetical protein
MKAPKNEARVFSMGDKLGEYVDEWIAVVDHVVVSSGKSAKEVYSDAKKQYPAKVPFVMKVPVDKVMLL